VPVLAIVPLAQVLQLLFTNISLKPHWEAFNLFGQKGYWFVNLRFSKILLKYTVGLWQLVLSVFITYSFYNYPNTQEMLQQQDHSDIFLL